MNKEQEQMWDILSSKLTPLEQMLQGGLATQIEYDDMTQEIKDSHYLSYLKNEYNLTYTVYWNNT